MTFAILFAKSIGLLTSSQKGQATDRYPRPQWFPINAIQNDKISPLGTGYYYFGDTGLSANPRPQG